MSLSLTSITTRVDDGGRPRTILDDVSLDVDDGRLVGLTGPSGSGKSTLLAVAGTLVRPVAGRVIIDGTDVTDADEAARARVRRERIGFVFQDDNLIASLTAVDQLLLTERLRGRRGGRARAMVLLERVGLADAAGRRPAQLSGGMRQRVNIARALMADPAVLLVDEPTSALDSEATDAVMGLLQGLVTERGLATLLVSHDPAALGGCDEVRTLRDGRLAPASDTVLSASPGGSGH